MSNQQIIKELDDYVICGASFNLWNRCKKNCQWYHKGSMCPNGVYKKILEAHNQDLLKRIEEFKKNLKNQKDILLDTHILGKSWKH